MNFKSMFVGAATAVTLTATALVAAPAQAATITDGSTIQFSSSAFTGGVQYVGGLPSPTGLNFRGLFGGSGFNTGSFNGTGDADTTLSGTSTGSFAGAIGGALLRDLTLAAPAVANFLSFTGVTSSLPFGTTTFSITNVLSAFAIDTVSNTTSAKYGGFFQNGSDITQGFVSFSAQTLGAATNSSSYSLTFVATPTPIPTPALLPGLVAFGVGVLRKRKSMVLAESDA